MNHQKYPAFITTLLLVLLMACAASVPAAQEEIPTSDKANLLMSKTRPKVVKGLARKGFQLGAPIFMRVFKVPGELEVWMEKKGRFELYKTYPICKYSGYTGPKLYEGDWQSPEGFYTVSGEQMNPNSRYHLSFNIGFPNEFDEARERTGSGIMVHGDCESIGCFAMRNSRIEEIYLLAHFALAQSQDSFSIHIFPFRMTAKNMTKYSSSPWIGFWKNLQEGYNAFERAHQVPMVTTVNGRYVINGQQRVAMIRDSKNMKKRAVR